MLLYTQTNDLSSMNLEALISGPTGLIHTLFGLLALLFGSLVLWKQKGSQTHKKLGYAYVFAMVGLNITAFLIYRLFAGFGIFHALAALSLATVLAGILPMLLKRPANYITLHYNFMYWSVIGLYGALAAETFVRFPRVVIESGLPNATFYHMTGIAVAITMGLGAYYMIRRSKIWSAYDSRAKVPNSKS